MRRDTDSLNALQKRESTGVRAAVKHATNPFLKVVNTEIKGKKRFYNVTGRNDVVTDIRTGEITSMLEHKVVKIVDGEEFVKIFANGVAGIYDLKAAGRNVLTFLLDVVQQHPNTDRIYLHFLDAVEEPWKISKTVFFRGLGELIEKQFVAPSDRQNMFFLNPLMIWNGDRFRFIHEYRKANIEKDINEFKNKPGNSLTNFDNVDEIIPELENQQKLDL